MSRTLEAEKREQAPARRPRRKLRRTSLFAHGEPLIWLTGGALALSLAMILGLLGLVLYQGLATFWPGRIVVLNGADGRVWMGEEVDSEAFRPGAHVLDELSPAALERARADLADDEVVVRRKLRTENFELTNEHYQWVSAFLVEGEAYPEWALLLERLERSRFYGLPRALEIDGESVAEDPERIWELLQEHHGEVRDRWRRRRGLEKHDVGRVNARLEKARLRLRSVELEHGQDSPRWLEEQGAFEQAEALASEEYAEIRARIDELDRENERYVLVMVTADGTEARIPIVDIVRGIPANQLGLAGRLGVYLSRWWEFLTDDPRQANSAGGVYPAIFGTVVMTLIMSIFVVPIGVLAALYLREYAKQGAMVSAVRIAVNNLAGVPSIVFGVFGLGFFCYFIGVSIDELFFSARLPNPTFGKSGILWASLTLALLTLPVVIVASEEALSAVPNSMREGSFACGATKWQTIRRIVLPRAMPGVMTGMILAVARGAGEVAPLMLVGAVKLAEELAVDFQAPFFHGSRSFMHLGFHIYDLGFQSQNSEAARPMVYTTTLLLITIVIVLNLTAIYVRARLRHKFSR